MALHLIKLCVGVDTIGELQDWIDERVALMRRLKQPVEQIHTTRMTPKRADELVGGSLYWVIKGQISARQELLELRPVTDADGIGRCQLVLKPELVHVVPRPFRPFQGWRYLEAKDAPQDIGAASGAADMPEALRRELSDLGLL